MKMECIWEHNGDDTLLYAKDYVGAFTRGKNLEIASKKMKNEILAYSSWLGNDLQEDIEVVIVQEKNSELEIKDAVYGQVPRTAEEMYVHTKSVNSYYFAEIGIDADNEGSIYECRKRGFEQLENSIDFLSGRLQEGSYGEMWSVRKVLRRFIWHDRIHAKAMWKMVKKTFGENAVENMFCF